MNIVARSALALFACALFFSASATAKPQTEDNIPELWRKTVSRVLPGSAICFWWWCYAVNAEMSVLLADLKGAVVESPAKPSEASNAVSTTETGQESSQGSAPDSSDLKLQNLLHRDNYDDPRSRNTDYRSRPRPRPRRNGKLPQ